MSSRHDRARALLWYKIFWTTIGLNIQVLPKDLWSFTQMNLVSSWVCWDVCKFVIFSSCIQAILYLWVHKNKELGINRPSPVPCWIVPLLVYVANTLLQKKKEHTVRITGGEKPQNSFVGHYLIWSQISADQKAQLGKDIDLEVLHGVSIDYVLNGTVEY